MRTSNPRAHRITWRTLLPALSAIALSGVLAVACTEAPTAPTSISSAHAPQDATPASTAGGTCPSCRTSGRPNCTGSRCQAVRDPTLAL
jgi:hypothetical protein